MNTENKTTISASIVGGIGDIIFGLDGFRELKSSNSNIITKCYLCSHAEEGLELVRANPYVDNIRNIPFKYNLEHFSVLKDKTNKDINYVGEAKNFCYNINPEIYIPNQISKKINKLITKKTIIIHMRGSGFSRFFLGEKRKVSTKELDLHFWQELIKKINYQNTDIIFLGNNDDKETLCEIERLNLNHTHFYAGTLPLLESIELIKRSNIVIGVDSFAKSVSLACKIPTIVFVNNHEDKFRDETFLNPYKTQHYCKIIHDANLINETILIHETIEFVERFL